MSIPPDFTSRVMKSIRVDKNRHSYQANDQWMPSLFGRWSAATALLMIGLVRIFLLVGNLFGTGHVAP